MVNWTLPSVTDNSGEIVSVTVLPTYTSPMIMSAGLNVVTYTAVDKEGNKAVCEVKVDVKG